jgi:hypothetical protein
MVKRVKDDEFPGFKACVSMMRKHQPEIHEAGYFLLLPRVNEHLDELVAEYKCEIVSRNRRGREIEYWLLELTSTSGAPSIIDFLAEQLRSPRSGIRELARQGLIQIFTEEAYEALKSALTYEFPTEQETMDFRAEIREYLLPDDFDWTAQHKHDARRLKRLDSSDHPKRAK